MRNRALPVAFSIAVAIAAVEPFLFVGSLAGDAQVHLVFAETAARGQFFEFNSGERVSGETSPGYMLLEAVLFLLLPGRTIPIVVKLANLAAWYLFSWLVYRVARRAFTEDGDADRTWPAVAALVAALIPGSIYNANVGMENGFFAVVVWLAFDRMHEWGFLTPRAATSIGREWAIGALLGVCCWLRPEGCLLGMAVFGFRLARSRAITRGYVLGAIVMVVIAAASVLFQWAYTGDVVATSILSRRILAMKEQIVLGPFTFDLAFTKRLMLYAPMTAFSVVGLSRLSQESRLLRLLRLLLVTFFAFYSFAGAPQLARYMIFIAPVLAIGGARGARIIWMKPAAWGRAWVVVAGILLAGVDATESMMRRNAFSRELVALAINAPERRRERTDELLHQLGDPRRLPVVLAEEPIQHRYELDERIVIRSLDGRTDRSLLPFVHEGCVDQVAYLKQEHVDFLAGIATYDRDSCPGSLSGLESLAPGSSAERGGLRFERLPSRQFAVGPASPTGTR